MSYVKTVSVPHSEAPVMLTTQETADLLNMSTSAVRRWNDVGKLKAYRLGSRGDRRFLRRDIESVKASLQTLR